MKLILEEEHPGELQGKLAEAKRALEALAKAEGCSCGCEPLAKAQRPAKVPPEVPADRLPREHVEPNLERVLVQGRKERDRIKAVMLRRIEAIIGES